MGVSEYGFTGFTKVKAIDVFILCHVRRYSHTKLTRRYMESSSKRH